MRSKLVLPGQIDIPRTQWKGKPPNTLGPENDAVQFQRLPLLFFFFGELGPSSAMAKSQEHPWILDALPLLVVLLIAVHVLALVYWIYRLATDNKPQQQQLQLQQQQQQQRRKAH